MLKEFLKQTNQYTFIEKRELFFTEVHVAVYMYIPCILGHELKKASTCTNVS